jgi:recombination protein RecT
MGTDVERSVSQHDRVKDLIQRQQGQLARALPAQLNVDRFLRLVMTELRTVPRLMECTTASLLGAVMQMAQLGLEPGKTLGHGYLLPFKDGRSGQYEATFVLGYKGMIQLAYRSPNVAAIFAREVREGDEFNYGYGLDGDVLHHRPLTTSKRGKPYTWYGLARYKGGGHYLEVIGPDEVDEHRARSKSPDSPAWKNDYSSMARKTAIRIMAPFLPLTAEVARAIEQDEQVVHVTADGEVFDPASGEVFRDAAPAPPPAGETFDAPGTEPF